MAELTRMGQQALEYQPLSAPIGATVSAMTPAKAASGDRNVLVQGACTAQRALEAGVRGELLISHVPVLFGAGRRPFDVLPSRIESEIVRVIDTPEATHVRYRVRRLTDERTT